MELWQKEIEKGKKGLYRKNTDSGISAYLIIGGVLFILHEYLRKDMDVLNDEVMEAVVANFLTGTIK